MKVIFRAIGGFFARIWRWIKETAWVQPLLIVSLIFGIILLIQPISEGIVALGDAITSNERIYKNNKVSTIDNDAYDLIYDAETKFAKEDKYFLVFVSSDCENCHAAYKGFKTLLNDSTFKGDYKIKTIYTDEEGDDVDIHEEGKFFELFFSNKENVIDFHEAIYTAAYNSDYYDQVASDSYEEHLDDIRTGEDLWTPLILLMDKETYEGDNSTFGIKEAMIGLKGWNGEDSYDKAETLDRMWNSNWEN